MSVHGSCLCGEIEFQLEGRLSGASACRCSVCRRSSGTGCTAVIVTGAKGFRWLSGEGQGVTFARPSGWTTTFCATCGSPLPRRHENGKVYFVPVGLLDGDPGVRMEREIFIGSSAAWDHPAPEGSRHEEWSPEEEAR